MMRFRTVPFSGENEAWGDKKSLKVKFCGKIFTI